MNLRIRGAANISTAPALLSLLLAATLGLTACGGEESAASPSETSAVPQTSSSPEMTMPEAVLAPEAAGEELSRYFGPKVTLDPETFLGHQFGGKTYDEDPSPRTTTAAEFEEMRQDLQDGGPLSSAWNVVFNETANDAEVSARNVSAYLEANPGATLEDLQAQKDLVVNRYPNLGTQKVVQDKGTGYFVVVLYANDMEFVQPTYAGSLVEQPGITPDFGGTGS